MKRLIIAAFNKGSNHWVLIVSYIGHMHGCTALTTLFTQATDLKNKIFTILIHSALVDQYGVHYCP